MNTSLRVRTLGVLAAGVGSLALASASGMPPVLRVTINPEARVSVEAVGPVPTVRCGGRVSLTLEVINESLGTQSLQVQVLSDGARVVSPPGPVPTIWVVEAARTCMRPACRGRPNSSRRPLLGAADRRVTGRAPGRKDLAVWASPVATMLEGYSAPRCHRSSFFLSTAAVRPVGVRVRGSQGGSGQGAL